MSSVGKQIKLARKEIGMSQRSLAGDTFTGSYICQIEASKTRPSLKALEYMAQKLNKPISFFYTEEDNVPSEKRDKIIDIFINLGEQSIFRYDYSRALSLFNEALDSSGGILPTFKEAMIKRGMGKAKIGLREFEDARVLFEQAYSLFQKEKDDKELAFTLFYISKCNYYDGRFKDAARLLDNVEKLAKDKKIYDPALHANIYNGRGILFSESGDLNKSINSYLKSIDYWNKTSNLRKIGEVYSNLVLTLKDSGKIEKAFEYSFKALAVSETLKNSELKASSLLNLGEVYYDDNKYSEALDALNQANQIYESIGENASKAYVFTEIARVKCAMDETAEALNYANSALSLAGEYCDEIEKGKVLSVFGEIMAKEKKWKKAKKYYKESIDILEKYDVTVDLTKALQQFSQVLLNSGEPGEASTYLQEALNKLGRLEKVK